MKQLLLLLAALTVIHSRPILENDVTDAEFGTAVLEQGSANLTLNDSGGAILLDSGILWIASPDEKISVLTSAGTVTLSGTARIESDMHTLSVSVLSGFVRIAESGKTSGETVPAGFLKRLFTSGKKGERSFLDSSASLQFCLDHPDLAEFGCRPAEVPQQDTLSAGPDSVLGNITIVVHPVTSEIQGKIPDFSDFQTKLAETAASLQPTCRLRVENSVMLQRPSEYSQDSQTVVIADFAFRKNRTPGEPLFFETTLFECRSSKSMISRLPMNDSLTVEQAVQHCIRALIDFVSEKSKKK